ncbi:diguanylate cyclase [Deinococcus radiomollis]|uniref:diguanylate cyclase n=1 Tax=Deinococcus radiomollis TaxID=468916 RepID=UPI0038927D54
MHSVLTLLSSVLLMAFPWQTAGGMNLDLRFVPPALMMLGGGPRYALPVYAALLATGWWADGPGSPAVVAAVLTAGVSGLMWWQRRGLRWRLSEVALYAVAATLPVLLWPAERSPLTGAWIPMLLANAFGFAGAGWVLTSRMRLIRLTWQLHDLAHTDTLTGLSNRRQYERDLRRLEPGSQLVLLDLDHFKRVNDRYGHAVGDRALGVVGALLGAFQNEQLQAYRIGGEEFALLIQGHSDAAAEALAHQVLFQVRESRVALSEQRLLEGAGPAADGVPAERPTLRLTCSVGLAKLVDSRDHVSMFRRADEALHQSKQSGRDRLTIAETGGESLSPDPRKTAVQHSGRGTLHGGPDPKPDPQTLHIQVGSAQGGSHALWNALLETVKDLAEDRNLTHAGYLRLLQSAVLAVPGAGAGTLSVLERGEFVVAAQAGFLDSVVGRAFGAAGQREWYGGRDEDALLGRPRLLSDLALVQADDQSLLVCNVQDIRANICVPVVVDAQVAGYLNLDSLERSDVFGAESLDMAGIFGRQLSALLTAQKRRAECETLEQALSEVQGLAGQLQQAGTAQAALDVLVRQLHAALWADSVQLYSVSALGLDTLAVAGTAPAEQDSILPGQGLCWNSVERQQFLNVPAVRSDVPGFTETLSGPHTLLLLPLQSPRSSEALSSETLSPEQLGGGEVWGLLAVVRPAARPFLAVDEACCTRFAHLTERALHRLEREQWEAQASVHDIRPK